MYKIFDIPGKLLVKYEQIPYKGEHFKTPLPRFAPVCIIFNYSSTVLGKYNNLESYLWHVENLTLIHKRHFLTSDARYFWTCPGDVNIVMVS